MEILRAGPWKAECAPTAAAVIDRLLHYSTTVNIPGRELPAQGQEASRRLLHPGTQTRLLSVSTGEFQTVDLWRPTSGWGI